MRRALTRSQASEVLRAAGAVPPASRAMFLSEVDDRLRAVCRRELSDADLQVAIASVLSGISIVPCNEAEGA